MLHFPVSEANEWHEKYTGLET